MKRNRRTRELVQERIGTRFTQKAVGMRSITVNEANLGKEERTRNAVV